jgi:hypothetical protein
MWLGEAANFIWHNAIDFDYHVRVAVVGAPAHILDNRHGGGISKASGQAGDQQKPVHA